MINGPVWVTGKVDGGLSFDGINDYIDVSSMNPRTYDDLTISAWYKSAQSSVSDDEYIFEHIDYLVDEISFGATDDGGERLRFGFTVGGKWLPHYGTSDIVNQQWHHLVAVRSSGRVRLYVDNVKETDQPDNFAGVSVTVNGDGPFIGDYPGNSEQVHGIVDDVRFYGRGLSDAEVAELFALGGGGGSGGQVCDGTFRDEFNAQVYSGNDGTLKWAGDWEEVNEADGPTLNDERVFADLYESPAMPSYQLHVRDNDGGGEGVMRGLDLSAAAGATLSFDYKPAGLDDANDYASVQMSTAGTGGPWSEVVRFAGPADDTAYKPYAIDISKFVSPNAVLRIITSPNMGASDYVFFDHVQITCKP